jgi:hypothetical protein
LNNDTTFIGALKFGENAPAGLQLMRFLVDTQQETVSSQGVHVAGDFNAWNPTANILYSFVDGIYEVIAYAPAGSYSYQFINGNQTIDAELVPDSCADAEGKRPLTLETHTILPTVCYAACETCVVNSIDHAFVEITLVYPNPTDGLTQFMVPDGHVTAAQLLDAFGRVVQDIHIVGARSFAFDLSAHSSGIYYARLFHADGHVDSIKIQRL